MRAHRNLQNSHFPLLVVCCCDGCSGLFNDISLLCALNHLLFSKNAVLNSKYNYRVIILSIYVIFVYCRFFRRHVLCCRAVLESEGVRQQQKELQRYCFLDGNLTF